MSGKEQDRLKVMAAFEDLLVNRLTGTAPQP